MAKDSDCSDRENPLNVQVLNMAESGPMYLFMSFLYAVAVFYMIKRVQIEVEIKIRD